MNLKKFFNVLEYTLLLEPTKDIPKISPDKLNAKSIKALFDEVFLSTKEACNSFADLRNFRMFYIADDYTKQADASRLDSNPEFWSFILKQHCIINGYNIIRKLLAEQYHLSGADFLELTLPFGETGTEYDNDNIYGLYYLLINKNNLGEKLLSLEDDITPTVMNTIRFNIRKPSVCQNLPISELTLFDDLHDALENYFSNHDFDPQIFTDEKLLRHKLFTILNKPLNNKINAKAEKLYDDLTLVTNLDFLSFNGYKKDKDIFAQLNTLEFHQVVNTRANRNNFKETYLNIFNAVTKQDRQYKFKQHKDYIRDYHTLISKLYIPSLYNGSDNNDDNNDDKNDNKKIKFELADKLYLRNQVESIFSTELIDSMYNIISNNTNSAYLFDNLQLISQTVKLPNVFSRQYILQMAVESLSHNRLIVKDFDEIDSNSIGVRGNHSHNLTVGERKLTWEKSFENMIIKLTKFIFPIFSNYFFSLVWKAIEKNNNNDFHQTLVEMYILFSKYLNNEDNVYELLNIDTIFDESVDLKLKAPTFDTNVDFNHYHNCIKSVTKQSVEKAYIPDLLSTDYFISTKNRIQVDMQKILYKAVKHG